MFDIMRAIQNILLQHLGNAQMLSLPPVYVPSTILLNPGDPNVFVDNTSRFRINDEIFIASDVLQKVEKSKIIDIPDYNQLIISPTSSKSDGWMVSEQPYILKAIKHQPLKRVLIGDIRTNMTFPTITISPVTDSYDWLTLRGTSHEKRIMIRVYTQGVGSEADIQASEELISALATQVQEILIDHFHLVVDSTSYDLTANLITGSNIASIADTSDFEPGQPVIIRDATKKAQFCVIDSVIDSNMLELRTGAEQDYLVTRGAEIIRMKKYLYETQAGEINYGYVPGSGGAMFRAAEISYSGKEFICRNNPDNYT